MKKNLIIIVLTILIVLAIELIIYDFSVKKTDVLPIKELRKSSGYKMINPVIDFVELNPYKVNETHDLENQLNLYINKVISEKKADTVSVYFRDLNNGPWIGIGEDNYYSPASLLKVPVLIVVLKTAEENPEFLTKKIVYVPTDKNSTRNITDGIALEANKVYTINELLEYMIIHSDNEAVYMLLDMINKQKMHDIYYDLGIPIENHSDDNCLTVKEYATFFRILYNATYLNKKMSEKALTLLSKTTFNQGIVAGVPKGITVAHKFGERHFVRKGLKQLHDCGIVYNEKRPYLLCIMTKGNNFKELEKVISEISAIVYNSSKTKIN
jgi:beta-lactamase class A